jgi:hypothetical protein
MSSITIFRLETIFDIVVHCSSEGKRVFDAETDEKWVSVFSNFVDVLF